jgi:DNA polymerase-1
MRKRLFLLDGLALVYRAHFALAGRPVLTAKGVNTSALFGFTQTLLDILANQQPTHLAVAFDTEVPTERHREYPAYKIQREAMPEDIARALPQVRRLIDAFQIPAVVQDGYEADDLIGTLVRCAEPHGFESFMVTPDKDFSQLVSTRTFLYKPGRLGDPPEILGPAEIQQKWGIQRPAQVIDILGLWGDASDNIPGVPGIGEKTARRLVAQYGSVEEVLAHAHELSGKQRENLEQHRAQALLSKRLATINCAVPIEIDFDRLKLRPPREAELRQLLVEFEFNSIGRRLFGEDFKAGRGFESTATPLRVAPEPASALEGAAALPAPAPAEPIEPPEQPPGPRFPLRTLAEIDHDYRCAADASARQTLARELSALASVGLAVPSDGAEGRQARPLGLAFATAPGRGWWVPLPADPNAARGVLDDFRSILEDEQVIKTGHDLKRIVGLLLRRGVRLRGARFDVMLAHALVEPELRHSLGYLAEALLGVAPLSAEGTGASQGELDFARDESAARLDAAVEIADLALQLRAKLEPLLHERGQDRVFREVEMPLVPVLVDMEAEGIRIDVAALGEFGEWLNRQMAEHERAIHRLAGREFNVNSPRQLGEILFEVLKLADQPKKTRTGQYATDEQTLLALAGDHEIVRRLLEYRTCSKLKSTYADALPTAVASDTGRVHTTYQQLATATGRLNSQNPNLQNIPIRTDLGQEIRKAFVPRDDSHRLLSADYSQIELRIIAALSEEPGLLEAFRANADVHTATAARVFGVSADAVTPEMRKQAKMVNYGIAYGISAFGLAQRLGIPRKEAAAIIDHYFAQFPGIRDYMTRTIAFARDHGYAETLTGRRRYLRDIRSANATVRAAAERNAINAPIQGTAADMIKLAMIQIHAAFERRQLRTRMLLQVHDELVFDLVPEEQDEVLALVEEKMRTALPLAVPIVVELGIGWNWLEAH